MPARPAPEPVPSAPTREPIDVAHLRQDLRAVARQLDMLVGEVRRLQAKAEGRG